MKNLIWAEWKKLRRSSIVLFTVIATILIAAFVLFAGQSVTIEGYYLNDPGWYMTMVQPWATLFVLPAIIAMLGSYMICREEQDDTLKSLLLIPLNETALTSAKMIVTFVLSVLIYLLLFVITFSTELILHYSDLSIGMVLSFFKSYLLEGVGVFLAVSPIIALVSYTKKSYWLALLLTEIYSFVGMFMSMSNLARSFYPITALLGVAGYYETTTANLIGSIIILLACGCLAVFILLLHRQTSWQINFVDQEIIDGLPVSVGGLLNISVFLRRLCVLSALY